jgi:uncharacterized protein Usg
MGVRGTHGPSSDNPHLPDDRKAVFTRTWITARMMQKKTGVTHRQMLLPMLRFWNVLQQRVWVSYGTLQQAPVVHRHLTFMPTR